MILIYRPSEGGRLSRPRHCSKCAARAQSCVDDSTTNIVVVIIIIIIIWTFRPPVSLQSAGGRFRFRVPPSKTTCLSMSHLRRHSRFSDNDSRPFCFPVSTKTLSYDSCVTITIPHYCLDTCGPCNNLDHVKMFMMVMTMMINSSHFDSHCNCCKNIDSKFKIGSEVFSYTYSFS